MSMRKFLALALACAVCAVMSPALAMSAPKEKAEEDPFAEEAPQPAKKATKKKGGKEVQAKPSIEAEMPPIEGQLSPQQLQELSAIYAATALAEAQLRLESVMARRAEQQKKMMEAARVDSEDLPKKEEPMTRVFPMPGGNPQVVAILGGSRKALEATLKFPSGLVYEVSKGMTLEGGYKVSSVTGNGVVLEKEGLVLNMPITQGESKGKPWDPGVEQGMPGAQATTPPPPAPPAPDEGRGRRR